MDVRDPMVKLRSLDPPTEARREVIKIYPTLSPKQMDTIQALEPSRYSKRTYPMPIVPEIKTACFTST